MAARGHLRRTLAVPGLRRLLGVRLAGQFGDGVFQASLAGAVLFNPERQTDPTAIAAGFAVLLLPYSVIGPFAGVLLDRWSRRRVLAWANVVRAAAVVGIAAEIGTGVDGTPFYASALVILSLSRFVLSALSASLPHVVARSELVTANALTTTSGALITAVGAAVAIAARGLLGGSDGVYAGMAAGAGVAFLAASATAAGFAVHALGPSEAERGSRETAGDIVRGLRAGAAHVLATPPVRNALAAIGVHRLCYGVTTVCIVLLYRNYFPDSGFFRGGLAGLSQVVGALAAGGALASVVVPSLFRRFGPVRVPAWLLAAAAVVQAGLVLTFSKPLLVVASLLLGFVAQGIKICVDTLVQQYIGDDFRGRVFALYDTLFNLALVSAAVATALFLPVDGYSPTSVLVIVVLYLLTAVGYVSCSRRTTW